MNMTREVAEHLATLTGIDRLDMAVARFSRWHPPAVGKQMLRSRERESLGIAAGHSYAPPRRGPSFLRSF
jgi:hypothetical protein